MRAEDKRFQAPLQTPIAIGTLLLLSHVEASSAYLLYAEETPSVIFLALYIVKLWRTDDWVSIASLVFVDDCTLGQLGCKSIPDNASAEGVPGFVGGQRKDCSSDDW